MATSSVWCRKLTDHPIFDVLRRNNELLDKALSRFGSNKGTGKVTMKNYESIDAQNIIAEKDGQLYIWDSYSASVLTTNLKSFALRDPEQISADSLSHQELMCSEPPAFHVDSLTLNDSGTHLALSGPGGLVILRVPDVRGRFGLFGEGKQQILCKTSHVDPRYFATSGHHLLQALWHPGSLSNSHVVLLTSDNVIRIYDISRPESHDQIYHLSLADLSTNEEADDSLGANRLNVRGALGEVAVSFDFGPSFELERRVVKDEWSGIVSPTAGQRVDVVWPVYILMGNGEVYRLLTTLSSTSSISMSKRFSGPLQMHPAAEDNYGSDACHVVCLHSQPPAVVIATCEGKLHHCLVLDGNSEDIISSNDTSRSTHDIAEPTLYVYETVELELSLTTICLETEEQMISDFSCPLKLLKDGASLERYHCLHAAGLHTVVLPWLKEMRRYISSEEAAQFELEGINPELQQAVVEHLLCTKPLPSSPPSPMLGVCPITDHLLGSKIVCLTATLQCIVLPLVRTGYNMAAVSLLSDESSADMHSPLRKLHKEAFDARIAKILRRAASNPILKAGFNADMTSQECLQLFSRVTQVFREEYVVKQIQARAEIEQRIRLLKAHKVQQLSELRDLSVSREVVQRSSDRLKEKYQQVVQAQTNINNRVNAILRRLQEQLPVLSDAEIGLVNELKQLEELTKTYQERFNQLQDKKAYNDRVISKPSDGATVRSPYVSRVTEMNGADIVRMREILKVEGSDIANLVQRIESLRTNVN